MYVDMIPTDVNILYFVCKLDESNFNVARQLNYPFKGLVSSRKYNNVTFDHHMDEVAVR